MRVAKCGQCSSYRMVIGHSNQLHHSQQFSPPAPPRWAFRGLQLLNVCEEDDDDDASGGGGHDDEMDYSEGSLRYPGNEWE